MAKPTRHGDKWRIRWFDAAEKRQSAVFGDFKTAQLELGRRLIEAEEIRKGERDPDPGRRTFDELCDYWIEKRAPRKRSKKDDESLIRKHLRPHFGAMCVRDIGVEEGDDYLNLKIDGEGLSDKYVHNHLTLLGTMLRVAASFKVLVPRLNARRGLRTATRVTPAPRPRGSTVRAATRNVESVGKALIARGTCKSNSRRRRSTA